MFSPTVIFFIQQPPVRQVGYFWDHPRLNNLNPICHVTNCLLGSYKEKLSEFYKDKLSGLYKEKLSGFYKEKLSGSYEKIWELILC